MRKHFFILLSFLLLAGLQNLKAQASRFYIEDINLEGNSKTRDDVIFEILEYDVGDSLTEDQIHAGIENLRRTEFFDVVTLLPRPGSAPGYLNLTIQVEERYWPSFRFKGGFSELDGWYLTPVSLNLDNIVGFGNLISLDLTFGDRITSINFNYINPNIFDSDFDFHLRIDARTRQYVHYIDNIKMIQEVPQSGWYLGLRSRDSFFKHFLFGWEVYSTEPDSFARVASTDEKFLSLPSQISRFTRKKFLTSAFTVFFNWDRRTQRCYPIGGWWIGFWFTQADAQQGSQTAFNRFIFDIRKYTEIYSGLSLATRVKYGVISRDAPFYEKFYLGGPNSLRGFRERSISPAGGGDHMLQGGMELRLPLSKKGYPDHFLTAVVFLETGTNILDTDKLLLKEFKNSYGFGLRFRLPFIGLLRMDFAYPFGGEERRIHFSLGHTF
jgi:outer membrane protein insertion porin family